VPQVDIGLVVVQVRDRADGFHQSDTRGERPRGEVRAGAFAHDTPILDSAGFMELPRRYTLGHAPESRSKSASSRALRCA
jgi:hypothetical protein